MAFFDSSTVNLNDEQLKYRHYDEDGNEYFEVDKILDKKYDSKERRHKYKVMWKGWPNEEDQTWEPYENLEHVRDVVDEFEKQWKEKAKKKVGRGAKALHKAEEKLQPEEKLEQEDSDKPEEKKSSPVKEPETEPEPIPEPIPAPKKETPVKKGKTRASKANNAPTTNILKDRASELKSGSVENEPPLAEAYSVPIKKKVKTLEEEDTVDPRIRKKEPTNNITPPKTDVRDNTSGFSLGKPELNWKPPLLSSDDLITLQKRPSQEKTSKFSEFPPNIKQSQAPITIDKKSMQAEEPPKRFAPEISAPKMSLLESIVNKEQENLVGNKPEPPHVKSNPPEKEFALNRNKSIPDESKHKPPPPPANYNPYNPLSPMGSVFNTATTSPFGQMFKTQNEMMVEDPKLPGKVDRTKSMIDDIDRMMEDHEPEELSLSKMDSVRSGRSDLPPQGIQRNKSEPFDTKKMQKKASEIVIDDDEDDIGKYHTSHHKSDISYGRKKERAHSKSRSRSRSPGHTKKKSKKNDLSPEAKDKDKGKFKDKHHHDSGDKYNKTKTKEREKDREREKEREKEKDREREREKEKQKEKERYKKDVAQDKHRTDHYAKKSHEVSTSERTKHERHEIVDLSGKNEKFEEVKIQKKRAVYKKTLYAKEPLSLEYDIDTRIYYKNLVNDYMGEKMDREMFLDMLCPEGNFKDDEIQEIKAMSWEGKVSINPQDYYFKVVWKTSNSGVQKGCRFVSWQEFLEEKPKEAAEFVMSKLMAIVTKYGTFGEI